MYVRYSLQIFTDHINIPEDISYCLQKQLVGVHKVTPKTFLWLLLNFLHFICIEIHILFLLFFILSSGHTFRNYPNVNQSNEYESQREKIYGGKASYGKVKINLYRYLYQSFYLFLPALYTCPPIKSASGIMTLPNAWSIEIIIVLSDVLVTSPMYPSLKSK